MSLFDSIANIIHPPEKIYIVVEKDRNSDTTWISDVFKTKGEAVKYLHRKESRLKPGMNHIDIVDKVDHRAKPVEMPYYDIIEWVMYE
jgi:hypothetical protein